MKSCVLAMTLLMASVWTGRATTYSFSASGPNAPGLSSANENPPHPESSGTGRALITWDTVTNLMTVQVVFSGLTTPNTAAHIHCCIAPNGNTGVATTTPTFTGFPGGVTSGTYSHTFNMLDAASYNPAFITSHGGTVATAAAALLAGMLAGQSYLNIHTQQFTGGEIRGFLVAPVDISIKPGSNAPVPINPKSHGTTPVAILSTATFDAVTNVVATSLRFGPTGTEEVAEFCNLAGEDVNGDGLPDLVCHFDTSGAGFKSGDTVAIVKGQTVQGTPIFVEEGIVLVGRPN